MHKHSGVCVYLISFTEPTLHPSFPPGHDVHRCDTLGEEGRIFFLNLSRTYLGYDLSECDKKNTITT